MRRFPRGCQQALAIGFLALSTAFVTHGAKPGGGGGTFYPELFVSTNGAAVSPYTNWATAARTIQQAADLASTGSVVWVSNGVYRLTNQVSLAAGVALRSVNGPAVTTLDGGWLTRCLLVSNSNSSAIGFTLENGTNAVGGGAYLADGLLSNCVVRNCGAADSGGGVYVAGAGVVSDCEIAGNRTLNSHGGGVHVATNGLVERCRILLNSSGHSGGGAELAGGTLRNCLLADNTAAAYGGGVEVTATGRVESCTIVRNEAGVAGGGADLFGTGGWFLNNVVYGNAAAQPASTNWQGGGTWIANATAPAIGAACVTSDPAFENAAAGDWRLSHESPGIGAGTNLAWMAEARDLDGRPRLAGSADLGAYEAGFLFVSLSGGGRLPYDTWSNAATSVQSAVDAAVGGDRIVIDDGDVPLTSELVVDKPVRIRGRNGADRTSLAAAGSTPHRVVTVAADAELEGLSLRGGSGVEQGGGALVTATGAVFRACRFVSNLASNRGAGVCFAAPGGLMDLCIVSNNATPAGAGVGGGIGANAGVVIRSTLVVGNYAREAGGVALDTGGLLENATVVGNRAHDAAVTMTASAECRNSVVYFNDTAVSGDLSRAAGGLVTFTCASNAPVGSGNLTADPRLAGGGYFSLRPDSPCRDAGTNRAWMAAALELDGLPRLAGPAVDMGAFECTPAHFASPFGTHAWPYDSWTRAATNLNEAVRVAAAADEIVVDEGLFRIASAVTVGRPVTLRGRTSAAHTILDAGGSNRVLNVTAAAVVRDVTLRGGGGVAFGGGALATDTGAVFSACRFLGNTAADGGGGLYVAAAGGFVERCVFSNNAAATGPGGAVNGRTGLVIRSSLMVGNAAAVGGGAHLDGGVVESSTVAGNRSTGGGGGVALAGGAVCRNAIVQFNGAESGGSNLLIGAGCAAEFTCASDAPAGNGNVTALPGFRGPGDFRLGSGSVCVDSGGDQPWMTAATDLGGEPRIVGGRVNIGAYETSPTHYVSKTGAAVSPYASWADAASDVQAAVDDAHDGDEVVVDDGVYGIAAPVVLDRNLVLRGRHGAETAILDGGASNRLLRVTGPAMVEALTIRNGRDSTDGGGALVESTGVVFRSCRVLSNRASGRGGALALSQPALIENCVLSNNTAGAGGGAWAAVSGSEFRNCLVADNLASNNSGGIRAEASLRVESCTVVSNRSLTSAPGGVGVTAADGVLRNSIFFYNTVAGSPSDLSIPPILYPQSCCYPGAPPIGGSIGAEPGFAGGGDFHLGAASPCRDRGVAPGPAEDLDGLTRPLDGNADGVALADIGAFEYLHPTADTDGDGMSDAWENTWFDGPLAGVAAGNPDGDLFSNLEEFRADTSPLDPASFLRMIGVKPGAGSAPFVEWSGGVQARQIVESAALLQPGTGAVWTACFTSAPPTAVTNAFLDSSRTNGVFFYRVRAER